MTPPPTWIDELWDLICKIYQEWGGDCGDLGDGPGAWIDTLQNEYDTKGAPQATSQQHKEQMLSDLAALEDHLDGSGNSLDPADDTQLRTLITNLRNDIRNQNPTA